MKLRAVDATRYVTPLREGDSLPGLSADPKAELDKLFRSLVELPPTEIR